MNHPESLRLHLIGPIQVFRGETRLPLSRKAVTLLVYLALEGRPVHRTTAARLLWPHASGMQNLRVELSNLRKHGIDLGPERSPLLRVQVQTDVQRWAALPADADLTDELRLLRGQPLSDLDDHGHAELSAWLARQRARLTAHLQAALQRTHDQEVRAQRHQAAATVRQGAAALGWSVQAAPTGSETLPFRWLADASRAAFQTAAQRAQEGPHLLLYVGEHASGRRETLQLLASASGALSLAVSAVRSSGALIAAVAAQLKSHVAAERRPQVEALILQPTTPENDLVRLGQLLEREARPVILQVHGAEHLSTQALPLLDQLMNWPVPLLLVLGTTPSSEPAVLQLLGSHAHPKHLSVIHAPLLGLEALPHARTGLDSTAALEVLRQAEGWWPAAQALLDRPQRERQRLSMRPELQHALLAEIRTALPDDVGALALLAALPAPFTELDAVRALDGQLAADAVRALLGRAVHASVLERTPAELQVWWPGTAARVPDGPHPLMFRRELQRSALAGTLDATTRARQRHLPRLTARPAGILEGVPVDEPPARAGHSGALRRVGGGYHLLDTPYGLTVLRLGAGGHQPPTLALQVPVAPLVAAGEWHWEVTYRVLHVRGVPLQVRAGGDVVLAHAHGAGEGWWRAVGAGRGPTLTLAVQATDVTLQLADVRVEAGPAATP